MGFIRNLFSKIKTNVNKDESLVKNEYIVRLFELQRFITQLLNADKYIAKSEFRDEVEKYSSVIDFFNVLIKSDMLDLFCSKNGTQVFEVQKCITAYLNLENYIDQHNDDYINRTMNTEKDYLDNILKSVDPQILLDEDQRRVVLDRKSVV